MVRHIYRVNSDRIEPTKDAEEFFGNTMSTALMSCLSVDIDGVYGCGYLYHDVYGLEDINRFFLIVNPSFCDNGSLEVVDEIERRIGKQPSPTEGQAWEICFNSQDDMLVAFDKIKDMKGVFDFSDDAWEKLKAWNDEYYRIVEQKYGK